MQEFSLGGIQQLGVGVPDVQAIWKWYRQIFGMDIRMFEEAAEAPLMTPYTGGVVQSRTATLAVSLNGGGGFEIWQYTSRNTEKAAFDIQLGDMGIYAGRIKCKDVPATYAQFKQKGVEILGELSENPNGEKHFFVKDPNGNIFNIVPSSEWFGATGALCGGTAGAMLGTSDVEKAKKLYADVLGFDKVVTTKAELLKI
jgi:catechol 2,3-dioxygenase-like lactoylglutathione lyase family enzyme